ncbi:CDC6 [Hepatospora eriocheir]|uniref:CDC6 n=1 Tax=Hepatospora eriocheir TaxID=1081669 RepID=A0A1X0QGJ7_9MICR|nr:CDC6 [Hepatospora eriocheir]
MKKSDEIEEIQIECRKEEISNLKKFIDKKNKDNILHIIGNPGTGKTMCVNYVLNNKDHCYINYYQTTSIIKEIKNTRSMIIVIDEFDKFYQEKKKVCLNTILTLKAAKKKLITISNNLKLSQCNSILRFKPYSKDQIKNIIKQKFNKNLFESDKVIEMIASKFIKNGDMREVVRFIYSKSLIQDKIGIKDLIEHKGKEEIVSIHHKIILENKENENNLNELYRIYLSECKNLDIPSLCFNEFNLIIDIYK